jgi:hypothetical protein
MPLQNRVRADGEIVAASCRGTMMGNRGGAFHDPQQTLMARHWRSRQWICCVLAFNGRHRQVMQPRRYTELFFLDEITALGAGHRPCFECRRAAAIDFAIRWNAIRGSPGRASGSDMDRVLHAERIDATGAKRSFIANLGSLPENVVVEFGDRLYRTSGGALQAWSLDGYGDIARPGSDCRVRVMTPPSIVAVLGAGYRPVLHKSAAT